MKSTPRASQPEREKASVALGLKTAGTLSALIFLISSIHEVLCINNLYASQRFLIGLLLLCLSVWAWLEVRLVSRRLDAQLDRMLSILFTLQVGVISARHWMAFRLGSGIVAEPTGSQSAPIFKEAIIMLPICFILFLAIAQSLIHAFSHAESLRAQELQQQMRILNRTRAELEESETRYRTFFNLSLIGTAILSRRRGWIAANDETCRILGYTREELFRTPWIALCHPDDRPMDRRLLRRLLRQEIHGFQMEKRLIRKSGEVIITLLAGGCDRNPGEPLEMLSIAMIDITSRKRIETELAAARKRERDATEQQRVMLEHKLKTSLTAAAVVHEIQQPLASILLHCRLASDALASHPDGSLPEWQHRMLCALTTHGDQVVSTMERMRMLLRNVETEQSEMDLASSLHSSLVFLHSQLRQHDIKVSSEGLDSPTLIQGDSAQLQIAVVNLVRNAIQAMEQQPSRARRLHLQLRRRSGRLEILVADSGPGFPEGYRYDTSWELLKSTKVSGMGLGLFLASTAASNHRGQLRIGRSAVLGGAEVEISLPWPEAPAADAA